MRRFSLVFLVFGCLPACGGVFTLDSLNRGWITSSGTDNGTQSGNSYYAGIDFSFNSGQELRDWFSFDISSVTGTVVSATLRVDTGDFLAPQAVTSETYQLTSLASTFGFSDLGTGTLYGSRLYTAADSLTTQEIDLSAAAITAIQSGGTFSLGGRIIALTQSAADEAIFASISGSASNVQLVVNTAATPEPASLLLGVAGLAAIHIRRRFTNL